MKGKQIIFMILLIGVISYLFIQLLPTLERLADEGITIVFALLLLIGVGYLVNRVISA